MAGMVVQHNLKSINANNKMNINVAGSAKSTEKLSSGYAINRAGDNAAGLAISEKMRAQTRGLTQAVNNSNDAISLIQTAEGGLNETHSILQRMRELSVQSANGTYEQVDRDAMQDEIDQLTQEIDRISESTEYNGIKLLNGDLDGVTTGGTDYGARYGVFMSANGTNSNITTNISLEGSTITSSVDGVTVTLDDTATAGGENAQWSDDGKTLTMNLVAGQTYTQSQIDDLIKNATQSKDTAQASPASVDFNLKNGVFTFSGQESFVTAAGVRSDSGAVDVSSLLMTGTTAAQNDKYADSITLTANNYGEDVREITILTDVEAGKEWVETDDAQNEAYGIKDGKFKLHLSTGVEYTEADLEKLLAKAGLDYTVKLTDETAAQVDGDKVLYAQTKDDSTGVAITMGAGAAGTGLGADKTQGSGEGLTFQIGANGVEDQRVNLNVKDMGSTALGVNGLNVADQDDANAAIEKIDTAINAVSTQRAGLGAMQNRLEYTVNNLTTTNENLTAAESQIRDTDMATEMINYTKFNILQQASQAMLAQANQAPQAVLQLLG